MKINDIAVNESTTSGSVATVAQPMTGNMQKRSDVGKGVYGNEPKNSMFKGKKAKKPYANSVNESKIQEAHLEEDDVIIVPSQGHRLKSGFIPHAQDRRDHEVEMARGDLFQAAKNAKQIFEMLEDVSEDDGLEGWVQAKITKAADYLNSIRQYIEGKQVQEMTGGVIAGGGVGESSDPLAKRITVKKWGGNDEYSWAVLVDGKPVVTGLSKREVPHYKSSIMQRLKEKPSLTGTNIEEVVGEGQVNELSSALLSRAAQAAAWRQRDTATALNDLDRDEYFDPELRGRGDHRVTPARQFWHDKTDKFATAAHKARNAEEAKAKRDAATSQMSPAQKRQFEKSLPKVDEASGQKYEMRFTNGKTQRFIAATPEEAKKKAKDLGATSLIKINRDGLSQGKVYEGIVDKIKGAVRREKAKELPLVQTRRDYAMGKGGEAYNKGETRKGNQYMAYAEKDRKKAGDPSTNPAGTYRNKTSDYTNEAQSMGDALKNTLAKAEPGSKLDTSIKTHNRNIKAGEAGTLKKAPTGYHFDSKGYCKLGDK